MTIRLTGQPSTTDILIPRETLIAMLRSVGGCIVLDEGDLFAAYTDNDTSFEIQEYSDPRKLIIRLTDRRTGAPL